MELGGGYFTEKDLQGVGFRRLGNNVKIHNRASLYCPENISIGNNVRIDDFSIIIGTGELVIGDYVSIPNFCFLGATIGIHIEKFVTLAPGVKIFSKSDDYSGQSMTGPLVPKEYTGGKAGKVILKKHVIVGAGSVILPGCTLGEGASVGALSLVNKTLDPWNVYFGNPAKKLMRRKKLLLDFEKKMKSKNLY